MTTEHLRPLLDDVRATRLFFRLGENLARAQVPEVAVAMVRSGRMTALSKDDGGVRGIVTGDVVRRLVARPLLNNWAQQLSQPQHPINMLSPPVLGVSVLLIAIQALCGLNPRATVTSVDGIGAYDSISRRAMLEGLMQVEGGSATIPKYWWEDDVGEIHTIVQGEGGGARRRHDATPLRTRATRCIGSDSPHVERW